MGDDWEPLTDVDRRRIARIRCQLDQEFATVSDSRCGHRRGLQMTAGAALALSLVLGEGAMQPPPPSDMRGPFVIRPATLAGAVHIIDTPSEVQSERATKLGSTREVRSERATKLASTRDASVKPRALHAARGRDRHVQMLTVSTRDRLVVPFFDAP